jgi:hypothetical protein
VNWQPQGRLESDLIDLARREAAAAKARGYLRAFRLDEPRG